jgi:hypothetical protein
LKLDTRSSIILEDNVGLGIDLPNGLRVTLNHNDSGEGFFVNSRVDSAIYQVRSVAAYTLPGQTANEANLVFDYNGITGENHQARQKDTISYVFGVDNGVYDFTAQIYTGSAKRSGKTEEFGVTNFSLEPATLGEVNASYSQVFNALDKVFFWNLKLQFPVTFGNDAVGAAFNNDMQATGVSIVPEPSTFGLLTAALVPFFVGCRRRAA